MRSPPLSLYMFSQLCVYVCVCVSMCVCARVYVCECVINTLGASNELSPVNMVLQCRKRRTKVETTRPELQK